MKRKVGILLLISLCSILISCGRRESPIQLPDADQVVIIQINLIKTDADKWGRKRIAKMIENLEAAVPLDRNAAEALKEEQLNSTISLIYADGTRYNFYFFQSDDKWYVRTWEGAIYRNADFITDYILFGGGEGGTVLKEQPEEALALAKAFDEPDLRFTFTFLVLGKLRWAASEEDAISRIREEMKEDMILYQYARFAGCGLSEDEMDQILEERINLYENAENYKEIEKDFEAAGITLREYYTKLKYYFRIQDTKQHLYSLKCEEFMYTDRIGDKVCKNITEYWNTFLNDVVYPDMQGYDFSDFMKQLDMAEGFYRERH